MYTHIAGVSSHGVTLASVYMRGFIPIVRSREDQRISSVSLSLYAGTSDSDDIQIRFSLTIHEDQRVRSGSLSH